VQRVGVL